MTAVTTACLAPRTRRATDGHGRRTRATRVIATTTVTASPTPRTRSPLCDEPATRTMTVDDCVSGTSNPASDGTDTDGDGACNAGDGDDDGDGITTRTTRARFATTCGDTDSDAVTTACLAPRTRRATGRTRTATARATRVTWTTTMMVLDDEDDERDACSRHERPCMLGGTQTTGLSTRRVREALPTRRLRRDTDGDGLRTTTTRTRTTMAPGREKAPDAALDPCSDDE